ncbi:MAG: 4-hydroxybenzoate octaprenyltransferase [Candidatus Schekmanbacteria bacterium RIFCSPHIGHO2_02_FULL_38_11]|uniref:4-hydroxybenzoate polyprenyltransferase n=1 Tax=Candidatus Schekmanbacteria bacterium RIFCSPLOWO2_12_FULL_38_15 TaxID=1817883 RepID=A0A1F7SCC4_9BACT|nr:MAG: 4-hydroxybenzoate octaprenyltransferase [Candidatus Schekmanbacteria bacterium GWA2_38_9]OGL51433.1 MAG: 4-hydroxybenzoate octaprenyltransferase [Candidatus Schekmanbacteria bacterium RIFCSPLOWO2_12_FULL_38_15]OGL51560.1 MAG: 4-hydroxybenzoate octaprenyltransferase [Candidatus Schekmanbacteria bacterium RIFCSPLOWO2_02_FULL_38_14]OGL53184.1 MAG: 4-hydroxybenzoate octaprenyltransferase [Candidatus Schekmanbacteria bacterium RIFCSPHIGHO2_02_FULL_38_11]
MSFLKEIKTFFTDIKIEHTVFALPFAVMSAFIASEGIPQKEKIFWIIIAMIGARSWAMAFNRVADSGLDAVNPRTKNRAIPSGLLSKQKMWVFGIFSILIFEFAAYSLNRLAFILSPLALLIISFYSYTKRFTSLSHLFLGLSLSIAPVGAWVAIREEISIVSAELALAVMLWTAGFDILYSLQDLDFDRTYGLYSIPKKIGVKNSLTLSKSLHILTVLILFSVIFFSFLGKIYLLGVILSSFFLIYEHLLIKENDLSKINKAFFNMNGIVSLTLMFFTIVDCLFGK